ncbi:putative oxidoreductase [Phaeosphaeria sp. MPI-PUGE-AT-0046c]|nr:putative oxidoreductase [Phaeosphaeria sp. MPI-PUGE-AT-0046c]
MATSKLPLRTALIGLSSTAATSWAANAHLPGLLSSTGRSKIAIKALLNSSVDAAKSAIKSFDLPPDTKAYGSPEDLAADPDIDFVICNTRVDKHYETIISSVRAGQNVYVEWPIAAKQEHINELVETAKKSGSRIAVGLQGRWVPPVVKMREILDNGNGTLGKVLSADVRAFGGTNDRETLPPSLKYFSEKEIGGNPITIGVGHTLDWVLSVVGEFEPSTVHAQTQLQRPTIRIRDPSTKEIVDNVTSDVPDLLHVQGALTASPQTVAGATLSYSFRRGQPFPGTPALVWTINCQRGEIRLVSPSGPALHASGGTEAVTIEVHHFDTDEVKNISWAWSERQKELPLLARGVSECLYAFAEGRAEGDGWASIESAAARARLIERFVSAA